VHKVAAVTRMETDTEKTILRALSEHPEGLTIADISRVTGIHRNTVSKYIFSFVREGIIIQRKVGVASLCFLNKNVARGAGKNFKSKVVL